MKIPVAISKSGLQLCVKTPDLPEGRGGGPLGITWGGARLLAAASGTRICRRGGAERGEGEAEEKDEDDEEEDREEASETRQRQRSARGSGDAAPRLRGPTSRRLGGRGPPRQRAALMTTYSSTSNSNSPPWLRMVVLALAPAATASASATAASALASS